MEKMNFKQRVELYRNFDEARQKDLEDMADAFESMKVRLIELQADLDDVQDLRRNWRRRAEDAENAVSRNQFVLVLIDGDGYYFKDSFLKDASENGGARAAHHLHMEVQQYLQANGSYGSSGSDLQVMVNIYANRTGLARYLSDAGVIQNSGLLDQFFCSFSQSQSLFQFIDCGHGKERADAKLRDMYRFYAYNAHCKYIFLACCHDNGYVAELDRYRHDPIASKKTILVHAVQAAQQYSSLVFPITRFDTVFESSAPQIIQKAPSPKPMEPQAAEDSMSQTSNELNPVPSHSNPAPTWSAMASGNQSFTTKLHVQPTISPRIEKSEVKGIAINKTGQRVDLKIRQPTQQELLDFEKRIAIRKLCNKYHLSHDCHVGDSCKFDHDPITQSMMNTLRLKARSIPCTQGQYCRQADCFYGHQCPWGKGGCSNSKCPFIKADMHSISDVEVAKMVPAED